MYIYNIYHISGDVPKGCFWESKPPPPPNNNMAYALKHFKYNYLWIMYNVFF